MIKCASCGEIIEASLIDHNMTNHPLLYMQQIREKYRKLAKKQQASGYGKDIPVQEFVCILDVTDTIVTVV